MKLTKIIPVLASASLLWAGIASAQPAAFSLLSPSNNDTIRLKTPYFHWQSSANAQHYEIWIDNAKSGEVTANTKTPTQYYYDSSSLSIGKHTWYVNAVDAAGSHTTKSTNTLSFTLLSHPVLPYWAIGPFQKYGNNPIMSPQGLDTGWESQNVYNPAVIVDDTGCFQMLYRAQPVTPVPAGYINSGQLGYAHGVDGITFSRLPNPVIQRAGFPEDKVGCEDPRLVKLDSTYYTYYTALFYQAGTTNAVVNLASATSKDMVNWTQNGVMISNTKNAVIVRTPSGAPAKINNKYWMYHGDAMYTNNTIRLVSSTDLVHWTDEGAVALNFDAAWGYWEPCIAVVDATPNSDDIVIFFAGYLFGDQWFTSTNPYWYYYGVSECLFTKSNMLTRIGRLNGMILLPTKPYESGTYNNCVFMENILRYQNMWWVHYGAGDRTVAACFSPAKSLNILGPNLAKGKTVTASSSVQAAANAVDSSCATRWESAASDSQWIMVDLGASYNVRRVILKWEAAYGKSYRIQVSGNGSSWTDAYTTTTGAGDIDDIALTSSVQGRYVRMLGSQRGTTNGYSLWEFEVFGTLPVNVALRGTCARRENAIFAFANTITCSLAKAQAMTLTVYSAQGKIIAHTTRAGRAGMNRIADWEAFNRLPAGTYCVAMSLNGNESVIARTVKMR
jgi:predicted GH43/DUF377 family glycosyl hydrolase